MPRETLPILDNDTPPFPNAVKVWDEAKGCIMWEAKPGTREYAEDAWAFYDPRDEVRVLRRDAERHRVSAAEHLAKAGDDIWSARYDLRTSKGSTSAYGWHLLNQAALFRKMARNARRQAARHLEDMRISLRLAAAIEARIAPALAAE